MTTGLRAAGAPQLVIASGLGRADEDVRALEPTRSVKRKAAEPAAPVRRARVVALSPWSRIDACTRFGRRQTLDVDIGCRSKPIRIEGR